MRIQKGHPRFSKRDVWNMDCALAPIIHQGLTQFKESKRHGFPMTAVNQYLEEVEGLTKEQITERFKENPNDFDHEKTAEFFESILDKIIFAFSKEAKLDYHDIVEQPYNIHFMRKEDEGTARFSEFRFELKVGKTQEDYDQYNIDEKQYNVDLALKIKEGLELFAKYFYDLWD